MPHSVSLERQAGELLASIDGRASAHSRHLFVLVFLAVRKISREDEYETTFRIIFGIYKAVFAIEISRVSTSRLRSRVNENMNLNSLILYFKNSDIDQCFTVH